MISSHHYIELFPKSWHEAKAIGAEIDDLFLFRGQSDSSWGLSTSLERTAKQFSEEHSVDKYQEDLVLRRFKSRAHQYIQAPPSDENNIEWLSILQHYGAPTRLLDFTSSFYVAAFFAIEAASESAAVWAISEHDLLFKSMLSLKKYFSADINYTLDPPIQNNFIAENCISQDENLDCVLKITPVRLNERLAVQQGCFLFNCNLGNTFEKSLCNTFRLPFDKFTSNNASQMPVDVFLKSPKPRFNGKLIEANDIENNKSKNFRTENFLKTHFSIAPVIKIVLSKDILKEGMRDLINMNINHASLFPGLEGYAKSMKIEVIGVKNNKISGITFGPGEAAG